MNDRDKPLLEFPCDFPIKVVGRNDPAFVPLVRELVERHVPDLPAGAIRTRASREDRFISVTVTVTATSRKQLDEVYMELSAHEDVMMVL